MAIDRASGLLLHPTSLPSPFGIGDLGPQAYRFVEFMAAAKQKLWQILPLGPTGFANSPYLCYSAIAGNPLLISPEGLRDRGWITNQDLDEYPYLPGDRVDYDHIIALKFPLFKKAFEAFKINPDPLLEKLAEDINEKENYQQESTTDKLNPEDLIEGVPTNLEKFEAFCSENSDWLEDYALFMALKDHNPDCAWNQWDRGLARRDAGAIAQARRQYSEEIAFHQFLQFVFFEQWTSLKTFANENGVEIFGDIPIYVAFDSADVWSNPNLFCLLEDTLDPAQMAGVPPDYFSETGQLWGNPVYDWEALDKTNYKWWIDRIRHTLTLVDWMRIDHFRGFESFWAVPHGETVAVKGEWLPGPGMALFEAVNSALGQLPIIAEDLGIITPEVEALRDNFDFPGMKILHIAFDSGHGNPYLPHNNSNPNCVGYTGTHDNNTTVGWFSERSPEEQGRVHHYLGYVGSAGIQWDLIRLAFSSVARWAIVPLQDCFGLGGVDRMNTPGLAEGNWMWRCPEGALTSELGDRLKDLGQHYGRSPYDSWG